MNVKNKIRKIARGVKGSLGLYRASIGESAGQLSVESSSMTFVNLVGYTFNYQRPDAMMTCRMGYCHGFESAGIPYQIVDIVDAARELPRISNPVCMIYAPDMEYLSKEVLQVLQNYPTAVWVHPWFKGSKEFFKSRGLDPSTWDLGKQLTKKILSIDPRFVFTATVDSGLNYFEEWDRAGIKIVSMPLACDVKIYAGEKKYDPEFADVQLAFVGGYWASKGYQLDKYLRRYESVLAIYGYSKWPYSGYRGMLKSEREPMLYRQALISPSINEPTVALLKGQINERIFKVFGSGGLSVVDAVPAYRELFKEDELLVPKNEGQFFEYIDLLLHDINIRESYQKKGHAAVMSRHTYKHRAEAMLELFN